MDLWKIIIILIILVVGISVGIWLAVKKDGEVAPVADDEIEEEIADDDEIEDEIGDDEIEELPQMTQGKKFPWAPYTSYLYRSKGTLSPSECVQHFLTPSNRDRIDVIQYDHEKNYCYGITKGDLKTGNSQTNANWSSLDLRPGYIEDGSLVR